MKKLYKWYDDNFGWLFNWFIKHPMIFISMILIVTINLITRGEYIWSTVYIVMLFFIVSLFIFMQIDSLKKNNLLRRVALYLMLFIGMSYFLVRLLKIIPDDYLVVGVEDWLGFAGALFGGFIAIYGIWVTLEETRKQNAETLALQSIPLLTIDIPKDFTDFNGGFFSQNGRYEIPEEFENWHERIPLSINNGSSHIAKNLKFAKADIKVYHILSNLNSDKGDRAPSTTIVLAEAQKELEKISALPGGYSERVYLGVNINLKKHDRIRFDLTLEYSDYLSKITHSIESTSVLTFINDAEPDGKLWKHNISYSSVSRNRFID